jgi:hypothetical protein
VISLNEEYHRSGYEISALSKENVSDAQNEKQVRRRLYGAPFLFDRMNETLSGKVRHF